MPCSPAPYLRGVSALPDRVQQGQFPFTIPSLRDGVELKLDRAVTFFVGENGAGKSTLLESIAEKAGYHLTGGNRNHLYQVELSDSPLTQSMRLSWSRRAHRGFFLRAESFFNYASHIDQLAGDDDAVLRSYGGRSLHEQSHGESFLSLFEHHFRDGLFLLDEPEAALSPARQLALLTILWSLEQGGGAQFVIATHSPLLFSYPGATVLEFSQGGIRPVDWRDTEHYTLLKRFLDAPERYHRHLFATEE